MPNEKISISQTVSRKEYFFQIFPNEPAFRWKQLEQAIFKKEYRGWNDITTLPKNIFSELKKIPWMSIKPVKILKSERKDTYKAILETKNREKFESVLMKNKRDQWSICVSSQIGCAMGCRFCATGKLGLKQNLTSDEIMDQYRFWNTFLHEHPTLQNRISNVVFMGMGEPLANYENVKTAIQTWLNVTDLGNTRITVSTVGLLPILEQLLKDPQWPDVKLAISLHSADSKTRQKIVPTSLKEFLPKLREWAKKYLQKHGNRRHHLTFEYVMLRDVNDALKNAILLANFARSIDNVKINLIPYNFIDDAPYQRSTDESIDRFVRVLEKNGITVTVRKTMGDDIAAACGQLIQKNTTTFIKSEK